jgi:N-acetylneuraminate synthase
MLTRVGVAAWKVASGEVSNLPMLECLADTGKSVLLSTGMSPIVEIDAAVDLLKRRAANLTVLQCTSEYPCPAEKVGLNMIGFFRERYRCDVGLSDHSGTIYPGLAAAMLDIQVLEVHVTLSREMFGPDVSASVTTAELRQIVDGIRFIETMKTNPTDKDRMASEMRPIRDLFTKSLVARVNLTAGMVLLKEHLAVKKPGAGIPVSRMPEFIGRRLCRPVQAGQVLREGDLARLAFRTSSVTAVTGGRLVY